MKDEFDNQLRNQEAGFHKDGSCRDQLATLQIIEHIIIIIIFVEFEKAFDSVDRDTLWKLLWHGVPAKIVIIICTWYEESNPDAKARADIMKQEQQTFPTVTET